MPTPSEQAMSKIGWATVKGEVVRPNTCELCAITFLEKDDSKHGAKPPIVGHHWNGYDDPFEVWWVCQTCNGALHQRHDGSLTKYEAKRYVLSLPRIQERIYQFITYGPLRK